MVGMFSDCSSLEELNLSSFDTSNVQYMSGLFSGCKGLKSINISSFNMKNVIEINHMFKEISLEYLDISYFNTSMFKVCLAFFMKRIN